MDLLIPDNWLRDFLKTKATPRELQKYLSLSGPTVDRVNGSRKETVYEIEVTTNRPDAMSVFGVAREAAAILPRYGLKSELSPIKTAAKQKFTNRVSYLDLKIDKGLAPRSAAVLLKEVTVKESPKFIQERLKQVGERSINNVVDISNYIMHELGQPVHTLDYDKISGQTMLMRKSKEGEEITTLDGKLYSLPQGGIVIEDGSGKLIDMPGIMGGLNSAIDNNTKNVLLFVQTYNSALIRKMAMLLDKWSNAARLYEKGLDPELVDTAVRRGIDLFIRYADATPESEVLDLYFEKPVAKPIHIKDAFIYKTLGIEVSQKEIIAILESLGFYTKWNEKILEVLPPSFRAKDIEIPEDVIEEIVRVYGYQNIPGKLMTGEMPVSIQDEKFIIDFELKLKQTLKALDASEIYTLSLVSKEEAGGNALRLSNPLGGDTEYLRTNLQLSLMKAAENNKGWDKPLHLFEITNVYLPRKNELPKEEMRFAGIFRGYSYREAKGILEVILDELNISDSSLTQILTPVAGSDYFYYEYPVEQLRQKSKQFPTFQPLPQFPPQIEDITLIVPGGVKIGTLISVMQKADQRINKIELKDMYEDAYTFRVWFQNPHKTLNNDEVRSARDKLLHVTSKLGANLKD